VRRWRVAAEVIDVESLAEAYKVLLSQYVTRWHRGLHGGLQGQVRFRRQTTLHLHPQTVRDTLRPLRQSMTGGHEGFWGIGAFREGLADCEHPIPVPSVRLRAGSLRACFAPRCAVSLPAFHPRPHIAFLFHLAVYLYYVMSNMSQLCDQFQAFDVDYLDPQYISDLHPCSFTTPLHLAVSCSHRN